MDLAVVVMAGEAVAYWEEVVGALDGPRAPLADAKAQVGAEVTAVVVMPEVVMGKAAHSRPGNSLG